MRHRDVTVREETLVRLGHESGGSKEYYKEIRSHSGTQRPLSAHRRKHDIGTDRPQRIRQDHFANLVSGFANQDEGDLFL